MRFLLLTGLSGAGKTAATRYLEDMGAFCVDNLPPMMMLKFMEACQTTALHCPLVAFAWKVLESTARKSGSSRPSAYHLRISSRYSL